MKNKILISIIALLLIFVNFSGKIEAFSDVPPNAYYAEAIKELSGREIINGFPDGTFRPNTEITRGQVAAIVAKSLNLMPTPGEAITFKDVPESHYFHPYITALAQLKIINGYPDGSFGVNDTMTRGQAAKVLSLAYKLLEANSIDTPFTDIASSMFKTNIETLYAHKITNGLTETTYGPNATLTRGSVAVLIYKLEQVMKNKKYTITYNDLQAASVTPQFEYKDTTDYLTIYNDSIKKNVIITPLKAGTTTLLWKTTSANGEQKLVKHIFTITEVNGALQIQANETSELEAARFIYKNEEFSFIPTSVEVSRADGTKTNTVDVKKLQNGYALDFYAVGSFIVTFTDGTSSVKSIVQLKTDQFKIVGEAAFEMPKLFLTNADLQADLSKATISLEKGNNQTIPVTMTKKASGILLNATANGEAYLKIVDGKVTTYFIVEVTTIAGKQIINVYEAQ